MTARGLKKLNDHELHAHIKELLSQKRTADLKLIKALVVMRDTQAFQRVGFYSLAEYMRDALGFSRDESWKTSQAVEVIGKSKRAWELLETGQTYISHLAVLSAKLTSQNADQIFEFLPGKSRRELEVFLSTIDQQGNKTGAKPLVKLTVNCPPELIEKIEHLSQLRSQAAHKGEWAAVLEEAVGMMIDKIDPAKKAARAFSRKQKKREASSSQDDGTDGDCAAAVTKQKTDKRAVAEDGSAKKPVPSANTFPASACTGTVKSQTASAQLSASACTGAVKPKRTRVYIPAAVRYQVFQKYKSQCCFVGQGGRRCNRRAGLQIDHVWPVSRGGSNHPDNLRLLCAVHNRAAAEQLFGRAFMIQKCQGRLSD